MQTPTSGPAPEEATRNDDATPSAQVNTTTGSHNPRHRLAATARGRANAHAPLSLRRKWAWSAISIAPGGAQARPSSHPTPPLLVGINLPEAEQAVFALSQIFSNFHTRTPHLLRELRT